MWMKDKSPARITIGLLFMMVVAGCSASASAEQYRLEVKGIEWDARSPAAVMIRHEHQGKAVFRHYLAGADQPVKLTVRDTATGKAVVDTTVSVDPMLGMCVQYDPATGKLVDAGGLWKLFEYKPEGKPNRLNVAGSFNGWSSDAHRMDDRGDGVWRALVKVNEGLHHYKFVVNGGEKWVTDPNGDPAYEVDDNYGGLNSGFFAGFDARKLPAPKANHINAKAVRHAPQLVSDRNVASASLLRLSLRTQADDVEAVDVLLQNGSNWRRVKMNKTGTQLGLDRWAALIDGLDGEARYLIELVDGDQRLRITANGIVDATDADGAFVVEMTPTFTTPDWAKHAVWYQIFPERFRNGDKTNDPGDEWFENLVPWRSDWWATQPGEQPGAHNVYRGAGNVWKRRYGGDLKGVREKLPYLRKLGVNAIYFNPIFEAESMHKYDASDFRHIDDNLGVKGDWPVDGETLDPGTWRWTASDKLFLEFVDEAHKQGFKVVIDGVFNHVGRSHPFFQDVLAKGKRSAYADWFEITDWGDEANWKPLDDPMAVHGKPGGIQWRAWDGDNGHLPVFKKDEELGLAPGPRRHIFEITKRWLAPDGDASRGVDGWRLDVPGDIPHPFWRDWRKLVKETKPDAYITGEIWTWAQPWLEGDQFDAVMNYRFAVAAQEFFVNVDYASSPTAFAERCAEMINAYPYQVTLAQQNLFDSHDTDRLASMFVNPDLPYDGANRIQDNGPSYSPAKPNATQWQRMRQAVTFQHTFVGAPMTYYGNEAGMWSPDDPSNRMPMTWKDLEPYDDPQVKFKPDLFDHYRRVIAIRHRLPALRLGSFSVLVADDETGVFAFKRQLGDQTVYVVLNRSDKKRTVSVPLDERDRGKGMYNWLDPDSVTLSDPDPAKPDARSTVEPKPVIDMALTNSATKTVELEPYTSAILAPAN